MTPEQRAAINKLLEERMGVVVKMRELVDLAESEERDLTAEEAEQYDRMEADASSLEKRARRLEELAGVTGGGGSDRQIPGQGADDGEERDRPTGRSTAEYRTAFFDGFLRQKAGVEFRVLSKATNAAGAYLVPQEFENDLLVALRDRSPFRQYATVITTDAGEQITMPSVTAHGAAAWIAENAAFTPSDETFGTFTINAFKAGTLIIVSEELLQDSAFNLEGYIRGEFADRVGVLQDTAYLVGDGSGKPAGLLPAATTVAAAGAAAITFDDLIELIYGVPAQYRRLGRNVFMVGDSTVKALRKIKDSQGQYVWNASVQAGEQDTIWGYPVVTSPDMPAVGTGNRSVLFGNFARAYIIRDVNGLAFQRLNELYALNGQVGFRAWHRTDGRVRDASAVRALLHP